MTDTLIKVESVSKKFSRSLKKSLWYGMQDLGRELAGRQHGGDGKLRDSEFWAVKDVSFELKRGECLGLIGRNGAGKTTLLRMLNGLVKPDAGHIEMRGRVGALIALGAGFHPLLTGRENIFINASILGFSRVETNKRLDEIVEFSGLAEHLDSPVQHYSSGMFMRLGFSIAVHCEPDILLIDEALAVGDIMFSIRCMNKIAQACHSGTAAVFVSHNELQVRTVAQDGLLMDSGSCKYRGPVAQAFLEYAMIRAEGSKGVGGSDAESYAGPIRLTGASVQPSAPRTGDAVILQLAYEANTEFSQAEFELRFWNGDGQLVSTIRPRIAGRNFDLNAGVGYITVSIDCLSLSPGPYRLAGGFYKAGQVLAWTWEIASFCVAEGDGTWIGEGLAMLKATVRVN